MGSKQMSRSRKKTSVSKIPVGQSARQIRGFDGRKHCGENQKHFEKFLRHGISATGNFTVRDPEIRIGKKKITGKNAITENDLEKMHETMDEL